MSDHPDLSEIEATAARVADYVVRTPTVAAYGLQLEQRKPKDSELWLKMELFQRTGSFKARAAVNVLMQLDSESRARGVTAFSAGNHAIATAYAARALGISAKVVMPKTANPFRVQRCRMLDAEIVFGDDIAQLLEITATLQRDEGRALVHPFEGPHTFTGTAGVGLEFCLDAPQLDAIVVPIGGGGLIAGIASAVRQINPHCKVYGVEPTGARGMSDSLAKGSPLATVSVNTIADSLGAPMHAPLSFAIIQQLVDDVVTVSDEQLREGMTLIRDDLKLVAEPACAAALAAVLDPLAQRLQNKKVGVLLCGSNIDAETHARLIAGH